MFYLSSLRQSHSAQTEVSIYTRTRDGSQLSGTAMSGNDQAAGLMAISLLATRGIVRRTTFRQPQSLVID